ncbi:unnamed protein product [Calypogeia fissa]
MVFMTTFAVRIATLTLVLSLLVPSSHADAEGYIPGESIVYSTYNGTAPQYPGDNSSPIFATAHGAPGADDVLFQNLLSAEWIVFNSTSRQWKPSPLPTSRTPA